MTGEVFRVRHPHRAARGCADACTMAGRAARWRRRGAVTFEEVRQRAEQALEELLERDAELLRRDAHERSITHRLAMYLEHRFSSAGWVVDCEYNRHGDTPKQLPQCQQGPPDLEALDARSVYPDIIIHVRGEPKNLLVIEAKKTGGDLDPDRCKLEHFTDQQGGYGYECGLLLVLPDRGADAFSLTGFSNAQPINE